MFRLCYIVLLCLLLPPSALSISQKFLTLKFDTVDSRVGPGKQYPIVFSYKSKYLPLLLLEVEDNWRKVRDIDGDISWVHITSLSKQLSVVNLKKNKYLYRKADKLSVKIALLEIRSICNVIKFKQNWVKLNCKDISGWTEAEGLWGINSG